MQLGGERRYPTPKGGAPIRSSSWKAWPLGILVLAPLCRAGELLHKFLAARAGPILLGRPLPAEGRAFLVRGPGGLQVPLQWKWVAFPPARGACFRWARLAWIAPRPGAYRLLAAEGSAPRPKARPGGLEGWLPGSVFLEGRACPGREGPSWKGRVLAERVLQGWGPPGAGLSWTLTSRVWACGQVRLTFRLARSGEGAPGAGPVLVPLPGGKREWRVLRGGGRVEGGLWRVLPEKNGMRPGEIWDARLLGRPPGARDRPPRWGWGDQPWEDPGRLCALPLPGKPALLLPAGRGGLGSQDRALGKALRKAMETSLSWKDPRDRGDLKDGRGEWTNLEYDFPWALVLQFLRTGNPLYLEGARSCLAHMNSTDRAWLDRPGETADLFLVHGRDHRGNGTETGHVWIQGLLSTALLTGDRDLLGKCASTVRALTLAVQDRGTGGVSRCLGWPGLALASWLEFTRDRAAGKALAMLAGLASRSWAPRAGAFLLPGDKAGSYRWVIPLWVQAGLLGRLALLGDPGKDWSARCRLLLAPPGWRGRLPPATLVYREGSPPRASRPCALSMLALALEGTAWISGATRAWRKGAHLLARGLEKALRRADARETALLGRAWPVVAARLLSR